MSFPEGLPTTLLTYSPANPAGGGPAQGTVRLELDVPAVVVPGYGTVFTGSGTYRFNSSGQLVDGQGNVGVRVLPNDTAGIVPAGTLWLVTEDITGGRKRSYYVRISAAQQEADLSLQQQINPEAPQYVPIAGPPGADGAPGPKGDKGDPGDATDALLAANNLTDLTNAAAARAALGLGSAATAATGDFDPANAANAAQAAAESYTDTAVQGEADRADDAYDPAGAAATVGDALTAHAADTTSVHGIADTAALVTTTDPRLDDARTPAGTAGGDLSGTYPDPTVAKVRGVAVSGTPTAGQVLTATSATAAGWQDATGGGGGGTGVGQIDDDAIEAGIVTLNATSVWAQVPGVRKSVAAKSGDRILWAPSFLRGGTAYRLDVAVLLGDGSGVSRYASTMTSTPAADNEGYAPIYNNPSFVGVASLRMFELLPEEIDGSGNATLALMYVGPSIGDSSNKVYFGTNATGYRGYILLWNLDA